MSIALIRLFLDIFFSINHDGIFSLVYEEKRYFSKKTSCLLFDRCEDMAIHRKSFLGVPSKQFECENVRENNNLRPFSNLWTCSNSEVQENGILNGNLSADRLLVSNNVSQLVIMGDVILQELTCQSKNFLLLALGQVKINQISAQDDAKIIVISMKKDVIVETCQGLRIFSNDLRSNGCRTIPVNRLEVITKNLILGLENF
ncbi:MAG: hypothetical protein N2654_01955 [Deltaproteobacteria bacterium]|nr:hypothetical protein [Deltaproteobacteria bacterium]